MTSTLFTLPLAFMLVPLLIPVAYCAIRKRENLVKAAMLWLLGLIIVVLYPMVNFASEQFAVTGYFLVKVLLFVIIPIAALMYLEKWTVWTVLNKVGVKRENLGVSIAYGLIAAVATIIVTVAITSTVAVDLFDDIVLFLDAFTEEFLFRGVLFLYLMARTNLGVAFITSVLAFILAHPQNLHSIFIASTALQAVLLTLVVYKTGNIIGAWISHGLNRVVPGMIRVALGL